MKNSIDRNSLVSHLTGYVRALFLDIAWAYLSSHEWERDLSRLQHELARKGSRILTLDMPALGKHFDKCLDLGVYKPSRLYLGKVPKKGPQVPLLLRDLYLQVFDREGKLRNAPNTEVVFLLRTLFLSAKKLRLPFTDRSYREEVSNFLKIERDILRPTLSWDEDDLFYGTYPDLSDLQSGWLGGHTNRARFSSGGNSTRWIKHGLGWGGCFVDREVQLSNLLSAEHFPGLFERVGRESNLTKRDLDTVQRVADIISVQFGDLFDEQENELPKHGPGAVAEGGKHINKYAFHTWPRKLQAMFPSDYYAHPTLGMGIESEGDCDLGPNEAPSRLIAVPKTQKGPRLIAAEPLAHQWIQQLVKSQLEGRLVNTALGRSISFRDQSLSGRAALRGSEDGSLTTIDLSSASDRLSCWLVERMLRRNTTLLLRLHACRTRWLTYKDGREEEHYIALRKFAPMGSAVTFPVQSIIYAMIATAALLIAESRAVTSRSVEVAARRVRVFGDDIIVPRTAHRYTVQLLEALGLRINEAKTFGNGNFRESCGIDAWRGDDVTPPYLLEPGPVDQVLKLGSAVAVRNNFYRKGFWHVAYWLDAGMSRWERFLPDIPATAQTAGRASFLGANDSLCRIRYNKALQREEVRVVLPYRKTRLGPMAASHRLFQWFIEKPRPEVHWTSGWVAEEGVLARPGWVPRDFIADLANHQAAL